MTKHDYLSGSSQINVLGIRFVTKYVHNFNSTLFTFILVAEVLLMQRTAKSTTWPASAQIILNH